MQSNVKPRRACVSFGHPPSVEDTCCRCTVLDSWSEDGNDQTDRLAGKATVTTRGLRLGKSKVLRNLRHYMRAQSPKGHRTTKKQQSTISFLQSLDDIRGPSPCKSDELWHRFKGHVLRKTSERRSGAAHRHGLSPQGIRHHLQLNRRSAGPSRAC